MTITSYSITPFGSQSLVTVTSDLTEPTIYWYLDGIYVGSTIDLSNTFTLEAGDQAEVLVSDGRLLCQVQSTEKDHEG